MSVEECCKIPTPYEERGLQKSARALFAKETYALFVLPAILAVDRLLRPTALRNAGGCPFENMADDLYRSDVQGRCQRAPRTSSSLFLLPTTRLLGSTWTTLRANPGDLGDD